MTFASEIKEYIAGAVIEAVVIGEFGWGGYKDDKERIPHNQYGKVLTWDDARPLLDYKYEGGFGAPDCHAVAVYTKDHVFMVSQYDGSTNFFKVERNPIDHMPEMPGG